MRAIEAAEIGRLVESLCLRVSCELPRDVEKALVDALPQEHSPEGREALEILLKNAKVAREEGLPVCQDTGVFCVFLSLAPGDWIDGDLRAQVDAGVARATTDGHLRSSVVSDPAGRRVNTGDNTPALISIEQACGGGSRLSVLSRGGGSENASRVVMLQPGEGWAGVVAFIAGVAGEVAARSCPPLILGVGVGGSFDRAPVLAKKALLVPLDERNRDPEAEAAEKEILQAANATGVGPGALGGTVTCVGVRILKEPCHVANLPVAVSVSCHALRRATITL